MTEAPETIQEHFLHTNYRSAEQLVRISNYLAENFVTKTHEPSIPARPLGKGTLTIKDFPDSDKEFNNIAQEIQRKVRTGRNYSDFAVLARTNKTLLDIEAACFANRVPYHLKHDNRSTTKQSTFLVMAAYYALVLNARDVLAYTKILGSIKGIGEQLLTKFTIAARHEFERNPKANVFSIPVRQIAGLSVAQVKTVERHRDRILVPFIDKALGKGYQIPDLSSEIRSLYDMFGAFEGDDSEKEFGWKFADQAFQKVCRTLDQIHYTLMEDQSYKELSGIGKIDYIHSILALGNDDKEPDDVDADQQGRRSEVTLATIHAFKGREAPVVFVANLCSLSNPKLDPEEENLCATYVAVTRAQDELHLSSSALGKSYNGQWIPTKLNMELLMYKAATERYLKGAKGVKT
jgi:DNA helicase-2/ATP-dependent DNA helicase PcrA